MLIPANLRTDCEADLVRLTWDPVNSITRRDVPLREWFEHYAFYGLANTNNYNNPVWIDNHNGLWLGYRSPECYLRIDSAKALSIISQPNAVELLETEWAIQQIRGE